MSTSDLPQIAKPPLWNCSCSIKMLTQETTQDNEVNDSLATQGNEMDNSLVGDRRDLTTRTGEHLKADLKADIEADLKADIKTDVKVGRPKCLTMPKCLKQLSNNYLFTSH